MNSMTRSLLVAALALTVAAPAHALDWFGDPTRPVEWKKPVAYTMGGLGVQLVTLVITGEADELPSASNFKSAFESGPRRDDDSAFYNFFLHPLWGSETYLRAREANMGIVGSFGFSLGASVTWEYLFESWTEHPSTQDLIYTTGIGWMLGELRYRLKQRTPADQHWWVDPIHKGLEHWGIIVTDSRQPQLNFSYRF